MFDNLRHHLAVLSQSWKAEREKKRQNGVVKLQRAERQFLPAVLEITETPASPAGRATMIAIAAGFVVAVSLASFGHVDVIATAHGRIIPSERTKLIQPFETGVIRSIHVTDGQEVSAGEVLIELDPTGANADLKRLEHEVLLGQLEIARLNALLFNDPVAAFSPPLDATHEQASQHRNYLLSEWEEHLSGIDTLDKQMETQKAEIDSIGAEIQRLNKLLPMIRERVEGRRDLIKTGAVAKLPFLELEEQLDTSNYPVFVRLLGTTKVSGLILWPFVA